MPVQVSSRLGRVVASEPDSCLLVTDPLDIRWLSGFTGSTSKMAVEPGARQAWLFVDGRYAERAVDEVSASGATVEVVELRTTETWRDSLRRVLGPVTLCVDPGTTTVADHASLESMFSVVLGTSNISQLRRVKDPAEVDLMSRAAALADSALMSVVSDGLCGRSEREIRDRIDDLMRRSGADDVSFPTIVAAGTNGARPHHEPGASVVVGGDLVTIDMGALVDGYHSDMTRTVTVGTVSAEAESILELVVRAQSETVSAVRSGISGRDVDAVARTFFDAHGVAHEFSHGTGHGVGLAIHEQPILNSRCDQVLVAGEVVTVEPGLYRGGVGGARIEDLLVVTDGLPRSLTNAPKELSCPPSPRTI